ncbi:MAG: lysine 2,3-aminomutase, partial [Synergistales bacterium]|nr:lysine 2,3-aminomutase [Synergistales bacterium]
MRNYRNIPLWKDVTEAEWNDWKWQISNRITTVEQLRQVIEMTDEEADQVERSLKKLRMAIT